MRLEPVYRLKEGIKTKQMRDMIHQSLNDVTIHEWITEELRQKYKLELLDYTIKTLHLPKDKQALMRADVHMLLLNYLCLNYVCNG